MSFYSPVVFMSSLSLRALLTSTLLALTECQNVFAGTKTISLVTAFVLTADAVRPGEQDSRTTQITLLGPRAHLQLDQARTEHGPSLRPPDVDKQQNKSSQASLIASSHRANLCKNQVEVSTQKRSLEKGLEGAHLTALVPTPGNSNIVRDKDGHWSGHDFEVLKDLSKRAGFTFELVETENGQLSTQKATNSRLIEWNKQYDIVIEHNSERSFRDKLDIFPLFNQLDSSLVLVTNRVPAGRSSNPLQKMLVLGAPYDWQVWVSFLACCFATGALYWILERDGNTEVDQSKAEQPEDEKPDVDEAVETMGIAVYFALMNCTTMIAYSPRTWPGRILMFVYSLMCVVFLAGYTANLATILVLQNQSQLQWQDMDDVIKAKGRICGSRSGGTDRYMTDHYPGYVHSIGTGGSLAPIKAMVEGKCDAAIVWQHFFEIAMLKDEYNANCHLQTIGPKLKNRFAGWTALADYGEHCTNLLRDVLRLFFQEMVEDGSLDVHKQKFLEHETTLKKSCIAEAEQNTSLSFQAMMGLFLFNFVGAALACVVYFIRRKVVAQQDATN